MDSAYWRTAAVSLARNTRSTPGFATDLLRSGLVRDAKPKAPSVFMLDAYPEIEGVTVELGEITYRLSNLDPME